MEQGIHQVLL